MRALGSERVPAPHCTSGTACEGAPAMRNSKPRSARMIGVARPRIAILDDLFPHPMSGMRLEEFSSYLDELPEIAVSVHCNGTETLTPTRARGE